MHWAVAHHTVVGMHSSTLWPAVCFRTLTPSLTLTLTLILTLTLTLTLTRTRCAHPHKQRLPQTLHTLGLGQRAGSYGALTPIPTLTLTLLCA